MNFCYVVRSNLPTRHGRNHTAFGPDGSPGYFRQKLYVYERGGEPCRVCGTAVKQIVQGQRSTYLGAT